MANPVAPLLDRVDRYQRRHAWLGFPVAVAKKFGDDEAGKQAALIAYYGFFSLFPLMLVLVTVLGFFVGKNSHLANEVVHSVLARFPIIGDQIRTNIHSLKGSGLALAIGVVGSLWGGMGVVQAGQGAMDAVWNVPRKQRPTFVKSRLRALGLLLVLGVGVLATTLLAALATSGSHSPAMKAGVLALSTLLNVGLFLTAFQLLTVARVSWSDLVPGAIVAAVAWEALQALGGYYLGHTLKGASQTYGFFGIVIGLLSWIYLQAQVTLLAAEVNVVRARHLWPRSLVADRPTEADTRVLKGLAKVEERKPEEQVDVDFRRAG
ncbi:MAG: ribonuclease [Acidimicrobiales bacterium]|nr:ribonuclease [Acidimicrobiales bacterium]